MNFINQLKQLQKTDLYNENKMKYRAERFGIQSNHVLCSESYSKTHPISIQSKRSNTTIPTDRLKELLDLELDVYMGRK